MARVVRDTRRKLGWSDRLVGAMRDLEFGTGSHINVPIAVLISFIPLRAMGITANIMSLGGIAIAIGAMADAAIVVVGDGGQVHWGVNGIQFSDGPGVDLDGVRGEAESEEQLHGELVQQKGEGTVFSVVFPGLRSSVS